MNSKATISIVSLLLLLIGAGIGYLVTTSMQKPDDGDQKSYTEKLIELNTKDDKPNPELTVYINEEATVSDVMQKLKDAGYDVPENSWAGNSVFVSIGERSEQEFIDLKNALEAESITSSCMPLEQMNVKIEFSCTLHDVSRVEVMATLEELGIDDYFLPRGPWINFEIDQSDKEKQNVIIEELTAWPEIDSAHISINLTTFQ